MRRGGSAHARHATLLASCRYPAVRRPGQSHKRVPLLTLTIMNACRRCAAQTTKRLRLPRQRYVAVVWRTHADFCPLPGGFLPNCSNFGSTFCATTRVLVHPYNANAVPQPPTTPYALLMFLRPSPYCVRTRRAALSPPTRNGRHACPRLPRTWVLGIPTSVVRGHSI